MTRQALKCQASAVVPFNTGALGIVYARVFACKHGNFAKTVQRFALVVVQAMRGRIFEHVRHEHAWVAAVGMYVSVPWRVQLTSYASIGIALANHM